MFRVGERRRPNKCLPGRLFVSCVRASSNRTDDDHVENIEERSNVLNSNNVDGVVDDDGYMYTYCTISYVGHDRQNSQCVKKEVGANGDVVCTFVAPGAKYQMEFDIAHSNWTEEYMLLELWNSMQKKVDALDFELNTNDKLLGSVQVSIAWIVNGFGSGWSQKSRSAWQGSFRIAGGDRTWRVEVRASYQNGWDVNVPPPQCMCSQRAQRRFTTCAFTGTYRLDVKNSDSLDSLLAEAEVPFVLHKLDSDNNEERVELQVSQGGNAIAFTTANAFYKQNTGEMVVDGPFQSVPTYRGTLVEKRLYWDFSACPSLTRFESYPSPVLMIVTRFGPTIPNVVEAWQLTDDKNILMQYSQVEGTRQRLKRTWHRMEQTIPPLVRRPNVMTMAGVLHVAVMNGTMLKSPNEGTPVCAYAALRLQQFSNDDKRYNHPLGSGSEKQTRYFENERNPKWNQVFKFDIMPRSGIHSVMILEVWNRLLDNEADEVLGQVRLSVPWIYNGCGLGLGPGSFEYYQATFKLRDRLDPTVKSRYGGGRVTVRVAYISHDGDEPLPNEAEESMSESDISEQNSRHDEEIQRELQQPMNVQPQVPAKPNTGVGLVQQSGDDDDRSSSGSVSSYDSDSASSSSSSSNHA